MRGPSLSSCNLEKYAELLRSVFSWADGFAICDPDGVALWTSDESGGRATADLIATLIEQSDVTRCSSDLQAHELHDERTLYWFPVTNVDGMQIGSLVAVFRHRRDRGPAPDLRIIRNTFDSIAACITEEQQLNTELDSMAAELTERYEELNLLYDTEDQVGYFREGQEALEKLVRNCVDYLDVGLAFLILPGKDIEIYHNNANLSKNQAPALQPAWVNELLSWTNDNREPLVINAASDFEGSGLAGASRHKILSCPVLEAGSTVIGVLGTVNHGHKQDFRNSDRNLLTVMARKASKIIHASYDSLTGLMRRNGFEYCLEASLDRAVRNHSGACVLHLNVDQLHVINDTIGHQAGDMVLREVARCVRKHLRGGDIVARLGGDDFGILLESCHPEQGQRVAEKLCKRVRELPLEYDERQLNVSVSIGVATLGSDTESIKSAITAAEVATAAAKELGRNRVQVYDQGNEELIQRKEQMHWVGRLQRAVRENKFQLYSQIIEPLEDSTKPGHFEILLRLQDDDSKLLAPGAFMPAAERYHLMPIIDKWVISNALGLLSGISEQWSSSQSMCSINLSGQSFSDDGFIQFVIDEIGRHGVPFHSVCFEITETAAIVNINRAKEFMYALKDLGCRFSLDDFGSGLSSFAYLKDLPVDYLKIDGGFVKTITTDPVCESMVSAINQVGHIMGLKTIAEFVENDSIVARLKRLGVDYVQGYGIGKPIPLEEQLNKITSRSMAAVQ